MSPKTEIERLDLVARAEPIKTSLRRNGLVLAILAAFCTLLGIISAASSYETLAVRIVAALCALASMLLLLKSRYALYATGFFFIALISLALFPFNDPDNYTILGRAAQSAGGALLLFAAYRFWVNGKPFADAHSPTLEKERSLVQQWIKDASDPKSNPHIVEFSKRSFWTGYWDYRLFNTGSYCLVEKFKTGRNQRLVQCRVRGLDEVRAERDSRGRLTIFMGTDSVLDVLPRSEESGRLLANPFNLK